MCFAVSIPFGGGGVMARSCLIGVGREIGLTWLTDGVMIIVMMLVGCYGEKGLANGAKSLFIGAWQRDLVLGETCL